LHSVISKNLWARHIDPYWMLEDDIDLYVECVNAVPPDGSSRIVRVGDRNTTFLRDENAELWDVVNNCRRSDGRL